jgi:hypothetical protein
MAEHAYQARRYCLLGADDARLAEIFEVNIRTIHRWKKDHPEFNDAIKSGKRIADADVASALYKRAVGASHLETQINLVDGQVVKTEITKHYAPDVQACIFWLTNRQPENWKNKVELVAEVNLNVFPPKEVLDAICAKSLAKAAEWAKMLEGRRERLGIVIEQLEKP